MAPVNDAYSAAIDLGSGASGTASGTLVAATLEGSEPVPSAAAIDGSVWYLWTAPATGEVEFFTFGSATVDTVLAVYDPSGGPAITDLVEIDSNDDGAGPSDDTWSRIRVPVVNGQTIAIQVGEFSGSTPDALTLSWDSCTPPANDDFANATDLGSGLVGTWTGTNDCATAEGGEPDPSAGSGSPHASVWLKWTAPSAQSVNVDPTASTNSLSGDPLDVIFAVWTGASLGALVEVTSAEESVVSFDAVGGTVYWFQVSGWDEPDTGPLVVHWEAAPADIDFATVRSAPRQGGLDIDDPAASFTDRIAIDIIDPDDDPETVLGTVEDAFNRQFLDESRGQGNFSFQLMNRVAAASHPGTTPMVANPSLALAQRRLFARWMLDGDPIFTSYIERRRRTIRTQRKEAGQFTVISGRRWDAWLDKAAVLPPGGLHDNGTGLIVGPQPLNKARRFNYTDPSFALGLGGPSDVDDWPFPTEVVRSDGQTSPAWTGNPPAWPDPNSWWIGVPGMVPWPAPGTYGARTDYYAGIFLVPSTESYTIYGTADDAVALYLLGTKLFDVDQGYGQANKWQGVLQEGTDLAVGPDYYIAAQVRNAAVTTENPSGLNVTVVRDSDGLVVFNTANNGYWHVLPNPGYEPGMNAGRVMEVLYIEAVAQGMLETWTLGFDRHVDSDGRPWPDVSDITLTVGNSYTQALARIGEAFADLRPSRAGGRLDAYVKGTAGRSVAVGFCDHPEDLANITELEVEELNERGKSVLFVWKFGSFMLSQPGFEYLSGDDSTHNSIDYLELGEIDTLEAAVGIASLYALVAADPHVTVTVGITPRSSDDQPYTGFDVFDSLPVTAVNLDAEGDVNDTEWESTEQVASISMRQEDTGSKLIAWGVELRDKWQDRDDRISTTISRITPGGGGTTNNATSARPFDGLPTLVDTQIVALGLPGGTTGDQVGPVPAPGAGFLRELVVRRDDPSGTTVVELELSGTVVATVTINDGDYLGRASVASGTKIATHLDFFDAVIVTGNDSRTVALAVVELNTHQFVG